MREGGILRLDVDAEAAGAESVTIVGLPKDQYGYYLCGDSQSYTKCDLNFVLGGNWLTLSLYPSDGTNGPVFDGDRAEVLVAIAE